MLLVFVSLLAFMSLQVRFPGQAQSCTSCQLLVNGSVLVNCIGKVTPGNVWLG